jgi:hypothetical protein
VQDPDAVTEAKVAPAHGKRKPDWRKRVKVLLVILAMVIFAVLVVVAVCSAAFGASSQQPAGPDAPSVANIQEKTARRCHPG